MKKQFFATIIGTFFGFAALTAQPSTNASATRKEKKMLVTYFSFPERDGVDASSGASRVVINNKRYGTTEYIAQTIAEATGANLFRLTTTHAYPNGSHNELVDYAKREADAKTYPQLAAKINNFADYDVIFVGYPNWWYDMPRVIYTLFRDYDFSGKTIIPFCTHGGSGFSQSVQTIKSLEQKAEVFNIPPISQQSTANARPGLLKWLREKGFAN